MNEHESLLREAADSYDIDTARSLIQAGVDINGTDETGKTALHFATDYDYPQEGGDVDGMIDLLICSGANVNAVTSTGWTPLHYVALRLGEKYLARLIHAGADAMLRNEDGEMPIHIPFDCGQIDEVRFLAQFYEEKDIDIFIASMIGSVERVSQILEHSPSQANMKDDDGSTPLMEAVSSRQVEVVKLLLERGADPNVQNQGGITALHIANNVLIVELLLSSGADPTIEDIKGKKPPLP